VKTRVWLPALKLLLLMTAVTGVAYPLLVTGLSSVIFPWQARGSLITRGSRTIGSALIGQEFRSDRYFRGRPSATEPMPYNGVASSGSNLTPRGDVARRQAAARADALRRSNPDAPGPIPADLVTASASGLDPDISIAAALYQVPRVAKARRIPVERVSSLVRHLAEGRQLGFLGEPRVNVLRLNIALDEGAF
jgi:K+-transporting ATPase ATPase C chain